MGKIIKLVNGEKDEITAEDVYDIFKWLSPTEISHFVYMLNENEAEALKKELDKYYPDEYEDDY